MAKTAAKTTKTVAKSTKTTASATSGTTKKPVAERKTSTKHTTTSDKTASSSKTQKKQKMSSKKKIIIAAIIIILLALAIGAIFWFICQKEHKTEDDQSNSTDKTEPIYSTLTGEEIADAKLNHSPTYCVQIPNADDGARPQAGLTQAGVVFEAIAERGITRFAAVFQNANTSAIGPIRSLRPYYLEWDTPFDCTVVHAGGSEEALGKLASGDYRNLDENLTYMWRENAPDRYWNNLFTSSSLLKDFTQAINYTESEIKAFDRLTPAEAEAARTEITVTDDCADTECTDESENAKPAVSDFEIDFGRLASYNTLYHYDAERNVYLRSYETGEPHLVVECPNTLNQPLTLAECGNGVQVAPSVVVAMFVRESTASDNYHEEINTVGSGKAYIFQNGTVEVATWAKNSIQSQIVFRNDAGETIKLAPGQLWIAAVPQYGGVEYQIQE